MPQTLLIPPATEPLHLDEAKAHLRVISTAQDALIGALIGAARDHVETFTQRSLVTRTLSWRADAFPWGRLEFPLAPVRKVNAVRYIDTQGVTQTWSAAEYQLDLYSEPARLAPAYGLTWPVAQRVFNAVEIELVAGYLTPVSADAATDVLTASPAHTFADGDAIELSNSGGTLPTPLQPLTAYYVRDVVGATFKLAASAGGAAIDITGAGTGLHFAGRMPEPLRQALLLLVQYHEQRDANETLRAAAELLMLPYAIVRGGAC